MCAAWDKLLHSSGGGAGTKASSKSISRNSIVSNYSENSILSERYNYRIRPKEDYNDSDPEVNYANGGKTEYANEDGNFFGTLNKHLSHLSKWSLSKKRKPITVSAPPSLFRYAHILHRII